MAWLTTSKYFCRLHLSWSSPVSEKWGGQRTLHTRSLLRCAVDMPPATSSEQSSYCPICLCIKKLRFQRTFSRHLSLFLAISQNLERSRNWGGDIGRILSAFNVHLISLSTWLTYAVSWVPSDLTSQQHLLPHLNSLNLSSSFPWYTTLSQSPISTLKIMSSKWKKSNLRSPIHTKVWMIGNHLLHFKDNWLFYRVLIGQAWWLILAVPTLGRLRLGVTSSRTA